MSFRRPLTALLLLTAVTALPVSAARGQTTADLEQQMSQAAQALLDDNAAATDAGGAAATDSSAAAAAGDTPDPVPTTPASDAVATTSAAASGPTPLPPAYLSPGAGALAQPVSAVKNLTEPDVPDEPLRIAALAAALLAFLVVGLAGLLRALGLRAPVTERVALAPGGRGERLHERVSLLADDLRDFLRRSR